jgi:hypothetical protein
MHRRIPLVTSAAFALALFACSSSDRVTTDEGGMVDGELPTTDGETTPNDLTNDLSKMSAEPDSPYSVDASDVVCPDATSFDGTSGFCVTTNGEAVGPFPQGMIDACKKNGGGAVCDSAEWPLALAKGARNANPSAVDDPTIEGDEPVSDCPTGTTISIKHGLCSDGKFVYGPFDSTVVAECQANGGAAACSALRFDVKFATEVLPNGYADAGLAADGSEITSADFAGGDLELAAVPKALPSSCGDAAKLFNHYNNRQNFSQIKRQARAIEASGKRCATYVSLAMREVYPGFPMRKRTDAVGSGGNGVKEELFKRGWKPVSASNCQPGDIAFTQDINEYGGKKGKPKIRTAADAYRNDAHSGHVFMVADNQGGVLTAIDNRISEGAYNGGSITNSRKGKTPAAYCLRAPNASQGCASQVDAFCKGKADAFYCDPDIAKAAIQCKGGTRLAGLQCPTGKTCSGGSGGRAAMKSATELACK